MNGTTLGDDLLPIQDERGNYLPENDARNRQRQVWKDYDIRERKAREERRAKRRARLARIWSATLGPEVWGAPLWVYLFSGLVIVTFLGMTFYNFAIMPICHARGGQVLNFECVNIIKVPLW
jgi:hypothetical protein